MAFSLPGQLTGRQAVWILAAIVLIGLNLVLWSMAQANQRSTHAIMERAQAVLSPPPSTPATNTSAPNQGDKAEDQEQELSNLHTILRGISQALEGHELKNRLDVQQVMPLGIESYDCVHNPARHYERTGTWRPECTAMAPPSFHRFPENAWPKSAFLLSLGSPYSLQNYMRLKTRFTQNNIPLHLFPAVNGVERFGHLYRTVKNKVTGKLQRIYRNPRTGRDTVEGGRDYLTPGEEGYRASMRKLFTELLKDKNLTNVLVLDDDVLFTCNFFRELHNILEEPRCGAHVSTDSATAGVLLLGSSIWADGTYPQRGPYSAGWKLVDEDMRRTSQSMMRIVPTGPTCFNAPSKVFGSFAVLFHRDVLQPIINWIDSTNRPFDHVFEALADSGYIVRAVYPSIAVQDLTHESSVDPKRHNQRNMHERAKVHRWPLSRMCKPGGEPLKVA